MAARYGAVLLLLAAGVALAGDSPRPPVPRDAEFQAGVDAAIERGLGWLREAQKADGSFADFPQFDGATTALAYHTLRVCGVAGDDKAVVRAWDAAKKKYSSDKLRTYSAAIYLMAIASHGDPVAKATDDRDVRLKPGDAKWAREIADHLVAVQDETGAWGYNVVLTGPASQALGSAAVRMLQDGPDDNSNTQYALLGLKAAARCGVPIDSAIWKRSLSHFLTTQETKGPDVARGAGPVALEAPSKGVTRDAPLTDRARGWGYADSNPGTPYAAMTAGGVSSVVICRSELLGTRMMTAKLDAESERSAWDGLAWLGANWNPGMPRVPAGGGPAPGSGDLGGSCIDLYEHYGVERAGILAGVDWMGPRDWYGEGAKAIAAAQAKDGSWTGPGNGFNEGDEAARTTAYHVVDTCFALLFLKRGTAPVRRGAVTQGGADDDINFAVASKLGDKDLADLLDLVLARWRRATDDAVKTRLFDGATSAGPRIVEPLLARMASDDPGARAAAHALLRHATGLDFGFVADAKPELREAALVKWQSWWMNSKSRLAYDSASRRFVVR